MNEILDRALQHVRQDRLGWGEKCSNATHRYCYTLLDCSFLVMMVFL
jgi:hypothetical protein